MDWSKQTVLITGGTGSFGRKFTEIILKKHRPHKLIIFSRDELKQHEMRQLWEDSSSDSPVRYFIGDVRDKNRLNRALRGVDLVIHAAAMKQVPACEYNPSEAVQTNIMGTQNIIDAAIENKVARVLALSTDKAVNPVNLYGATKLVAEKLFIQSNSYSTAAGTHFSCVRYGNVAGSRGSVIPLFQEQRKTGLIKITDKEMTRFWITLEQGVEFVIRCVSMMNGGEIFVPKIPSMKILDLAKVIAPNCKIEYSGIRPGEKIHESLLSHDEIRHTVQSDDMFIVLPLFPFWNNKLWSEAKSLPGDFNYSSATNQDGCSSEKLGQILREQKLL